MPYEDQYMDPNQYFSTMTVHPVPTEFVSTSLSQKVISFHKAIYFHSLTPPPISVAVL